MKGDFSRLSFDRRRHFSRVLLQQGRVLTDADFNEQAAIQQGFLRNVVVDLVGARHAVGNGFAVSAAGAADFVIAPGRFYLGGLPCTNEERCTWRTQPFPSDETFPPRAFVAYLEGWERAVSPAEDASLLEPALGGIDTSVRGHIAWQVRLLAVASATSMVGPVLAGLKTRAAAGDQDAGDKHRRLTAALKAFTRTPSNAKAADALFDLLDGAPPCLAAGTVGGYLSAENRFYRIEIHDPGNAGSASFKWSRNNGGTVFAVLRLDIGSAAVIATLATHDLSALQIGDRVELTSDATLFARQPAPLLRLTAIDPANATVTLAGSAPVNLDGVGVALRRWDHRDGANAHGAIPIVEGSAVALEDGIVLHFTPGGCYEAGDYWNFAARPQIGEILWPVDTNGAPRQLPPHGPGRQRASLASFTKTGRTWRVRRYRARK
jgi:hypothetical protein